MQMKPIKLMGLSDTNRSPSPGQKNTQSFNKVEEKNLPFCYVTKRQRKNQNEEQILKPCQRDKKKNNSETRRSNKS